MPIRTQISVTAAHYERLKKQAKREGVTIAVLVERALEKEEKKP